MTPKEKAFELYNKFNKIIDEYDHYNDRNIPAKELCIILVDEIIQSICPFANWLTMWDSPDANYTHDYDGASSYWQSVKEEINKL